MVKSSGAAQIANSVLGLAFFVVAAWTLDDTQVGGFATGWALALLLAIVGRVLFAESVAIRGRNSPLTLLRAGTGANVVALVSVGTLCLLSAATAGSTVALIAAAVIWAFRDAYRQLVVVRGQLTWIACDAIAIVALAFALLGAPFVLMWALVGSTGTVLILAQRSLWGPRTSAVSEVSTARLLLDATMQAGVGQIVQLAALPVLGATGAAAFRALGVIFAPIGVTISALYSVLLPSLVRHPDRLKDTFRVSTAVIVTSVILLTGLLMVTPTEWFGIILPPLSGANWLWFMLTGISLLGVGLSALLILRLRVEGAHRWITAMRVPASVIAVAGPLLGSLVSDSLAGWLSGSAIASIAVTAMWGGATSHWRKGRR